MNSPRGRSGTPSGDTFCLAPFLKHRTAKQHNNQEDRDFIDENKLKIVSFLFGVVIFI